MKPSQIRGFLRDMIRDTMKRVRIGDYHLFYEPIEKDVRTIALNAHSDHATAGREWIEGRMSSRGRSMSGAEVLFGLLAGAAVAFILAFHDQPDVRDLPIIGFALSLLCILPSPKELFPRRVEDEFVEVLRKLGEAEAASQDVKKDPRLSESASRSHTQRGRLRRLRFGQFFLILGLVGGLVRLLLG